MLQHIHIHNFAIVDSLALDLSPGMTVLTGETGAGKSILLDALGLALGDRAESGLIRPGTERAEVSAEFNIQSLPTIQQWLRDQELDDENQCLIRRTVNANGPSKGFINGRPVPMQLLRELGEQLVDIHGQHAHQSLLKRGAQRDALDAYADHESLLETIAEQFTTWQTLNAQIQDLQTSRQQRDDRLELLLYQVEELQQLDLGEKELEELDTEHQRLSNLNQLREGAQSLLQALSEDDQFAIADGLDHATTELDNLLAMDPALANASEALKSAAVQTRDAVGEIRDYLDDLSLDPERLQWLDERLTAIHDLARKHRTPPEQLPGLLIQLGQELTDLEKADVLMGDIGRQVEQAERHYQQTAQQLSASRRKAAKKLAKSVTDNMHQLGMPNGEFSVQFENLESFSLHGLERVEYHVTTNPGQPAQPLSKVASGGELARISLAIQVITAGRGGISTLIFDEVDVGIGGGTAEVVGRLLRNLSDARQVMCVTHQPQVAALAHHHLQVSKQADRKQTIAAVAPIQEQQRVDEIARMLGGLEITEQTLSHAREMIERGQQPLV